MLGSNHEDFLEYKSIITALKNLPETNETSYEKTNERNRESKIIYKRLSAIFNKNKLINNFIKKNLLSLKCCPKNIALVKEFMICWNCRLTGLHTGEFPQI